MKKTTFIIGDKIEEMNTSVKENVQFTNTKAQKIQQTWYNKTKSTKSMDGRNHKKREDTQLKDTENSFNKIIKKTSLSKRGDAYPGTRSIQITKQTGQEKTLPQPHKNKNTKPTEEGTLKSAQKKDLETYKGRFIGIEPDFPVETLIPRRAWIDFSLNYETIDVSPKYYTQQNFQP